MRGIDRNTGKHIEGIERLKQSIEDILTTPIGSRLMRRDYGSNLYRRIDMPINSSTIIDIYADTAEAIEKWEPDFKLEQVRLASAEPGKLIIDLFGSYQGNNVKLNGIAIQK